MRELVSNLVAKAGRGAPPPKAALGAAASATRGQQARTFRLWMTGSLAMVALSFFGGRAGSQGDRPMTATRLQRHSPYSVEETVRRIEVAVREQGLSVMARLGEAQQPVIVLASSVGGTPVLMGESDSHPDMPLSVRIRASLFGGSDIVMMCPSREPDTDWCDLPDSVIEDIASLPQLIEAALS